MIFTTVLRMKLAAGSLTRNLFEGPTESYTTKCKFLFDPDDPGAEILRAIVPELIRQIFELISRSFIG